MVNFSSLDGHINVDLNGECDGGSCGNCLTCRRKVAVDIVGYVLRTRFTERGRSYENSGPEEKRYVQATVLRMLDVAGLTDPAKTKEPVVDTERMRRSEWGWAMRQRQLDKRRSSG